MIDNPMNHYQTNGLFNLILFEYWEIKLRKSYATLFQKADAQKFRKTIKDSMSFEEYCKIFL